MSKLKYSNESNNFSYTFPSKETIAQGRYKLLENSDGTISLLIFNGSDFTPLTSIYNKNYCEYLGYSFDSENQLCKWSNLSYECNFEPFKIVLNPNLNDSVTFNSDINETCSLNISFDYLFNFDCLELEASISNELNNRDDVFNLNSNLQLESQISEKNSEIETINNLIELEKSYDIPFVIICDSKSYCLTEDGLIGWKNIIGSDRYNKWLETFGSDTTIYGCEDVNMFIMNAPLGFTWFTESCGFSVYDKAQSNEKINNYENQLIELESSISDINQRLSELESFDVKSNRNCNNYIDIFEKLDIRFNLEKLNKETGRLETVYQDTLFKLDEGSLSDYIVNNLDSSGLLINNECNISDTITSELIEQYVNNNGSITNSVRSIFKKWFNNTCWLKYNKLISDSEIINDIINEKINISISVKNSCTNFSILIDRLKINKDCEKVENIETFISEPPKFQFNRVLDNKKSWLGNDSKTDRNFDLKYRETEYVSNERRLAINSKEIDLNLSPARAVEQDVWCYVNDNNCILEKNCTQSDVFEPYFCPVGFELDLNPTNCIMSAVTTTSNNGITRFADRYYNFNRVNHYGLRGTIFVEDDVNELTWPIFWTGTPVNTWVGPYYNVDYLTDSSGVTITHTGFGTEFRPGNTLRWSSPDAFSGFYSEFGTSELPLVNGLNNPNLLWGGTPGLNSMVMSGRLFNAGIWVSGTGVNDEYFSNKWIGFSECINIEETGIYNIGFAGDDKVRVKINGNWLINPDITPNRPIGPDSGFDTFRVNSRYTQAYVVMPITLYEGKNVIEFEGFNDVKGSSAGFVFEIYQATTNELKSMYTEEQLNEVTIFSTNDFIGDKFDVVGDEGFFCPTGYALDTCLPEPYQCLQINRIPSIETEGPYCCCPGDLITVTGLNGALIQLDVETPTGKTFNCEDVFNTYTANTEIVTIDSKCREVFKIGNETDTTFDGFWITQENDGTIGVYDVNWISGTTADTYVSVTDLVDSECCTLISDIFKLDSDNNLQGDNIYPSVSWDKNLRKCVYQRCGDDGCIVIDDLLTTDLSEIKTVKDFSETLSSELIDVKTRQTTSSYSTLKMLYERYNNHALEFCDIDSSKFDYFDMDNFGKTIGDYWVDLIEQVIPATTLWNSTYLYRNTVFDQQKFKYKRTSLFTCVDPSFEFSIDSKGYESEVDVIIETLPKSNSDLPTKEECSGVWVLSNGSNSEYFGNVGILNKTGEILEKSNKTFSEIRER